MKKVFVISNMYPSKEHLAYGIFVKNQVEQLEQEGIDTVLAVNTNPKNRKEKCYSEIFKVGSTVYACIPCKQAEYFANT